MGGRGATPLHRAALMGQLDRIGALLGLGVHRALWHSMRAHPLRQPHTLITGTTP